MCTKVDVCDLASGHGYPPPFVLAQSPQVDLLVGQESACWHPAAVALPGCCPGPATPKAASVGTAGPLEAADAKFGPVAGPFSPGSRPVPPDSESGEPQRMDSRDKPQLVNGPDKVSWLLCGLEMVLQDEDTGEELTTSLMYVVLLAE